MRGKDSTEMALGIRGEPACVATTRFSCLLASAGLMSKVLRRNSGITFALDETFSANGPNGWLFAPADFLSLLPNEIPVELLLATLGTLGVFRKSCG